MTPGLCVYVTLQVFQFAVFETKGFLFADAQSFALDVNSTLRLFDFCSAFDCHLSTVNLLPDVELAPFIIQISEL